METGTVVRSIAGHDKNLFYVVVGTEAGRVLIADGKRRKLEKPKAKNLCHVRPTRTVISKENQATNKKLRELLKPFNEDVASERGR